MKTTNKLLGDSTPVAACGLRANQLQVRQIRISQIDRKDKRFQFRLTADHTELLDSIRRNGQVVPITLWDRQPYVVIDGFRRLEALRALGRETVSAVVREGLDENGAFIASFVENVQRRNLSAVDRAHAIRLMLRKRRLSVESIARELQISLRQVQRYLQLLELEPPLINAVDTGRIGMGHAVALHRARVSDIEAAIAEVERAKLSVTATRKRFRARHGGRPRIYVTLDDRGFRVSGFRFSPHLPQAEQLRMLDALRAAAARIEQEIDKPGLAKLPSAPILAPPVHERQAASTASSR